MADPVTEEPPIAVSEPTEDVAALPPSMSTTSVTSSSSSSSMSSPPTSTPVVWGKDSMIVKTMRRGKALVGILSGILIVGVVIMVIVIIIACSTSPVPDAITSGFEWRQYGGTGQANNISSGAYTFALLEDGNAVVYNRNTGQIISTSVGITNGRGTSMTFDSNTGSLTVSTNTTEIATVFPVDDTSEDYQLIILPTGTVIIKDGEGKITDVTSESWAAS